MVAASKDSKNTAYTFSIRCAKECLGDEKSSLAITDSTPQSGTAPREMKICPLFFTAAQTRRNLDSRKHNGDKRGSWCQTGQQFADFETAGHTLLHEMTHLDALAKAAGLPARTEDDFTSHATDDVAIYGNDYVKAARLFLLDWVAMKFPDDALKPFQNAENIAAAATEWWFIKKCHFTEISL